MKHKLILSLLLLGALPYAQAVDFEDYARVVNVTGQSKRVNNPREECYTAYETVETNQPNNERGVGGSVIGGVAGALLGNQVGGGNGRTVATAAGAITGAIVGDRLQNSNNQYTPNRPTTEQRPVRRCHTVDNWETRPASDYNVTYEYQGRRFTEVMPFNPGRRLKIHVEITPADY